MPSTLNIVRHKRPDGLELAVSGRLDGYWADHLLEAVDEVLREGIHCLFLNLSETYYVSSAGVRVLMQAYRQFTSVNGSFRVVEPSPAVLQVLSLVGLASMLLAERAPDKPAAAQDQATRREVDGSVFDLYGSAAQSGIVCRPLGRPERLRSIGFTEADATILEAGRDVFALGLGAFGEDWNACRDRFGEFISVAGHAACQPTDGSNFPDYMMSSGAFIPRITVLYGLAFQGPFSRFLRFETDAARGPVGLSRILSVCLEESGAAAAAAVFVAESPGLLGASLRASPVARAADGPDRFAYPAIRNWISYSPERLFPRTVAVAAGIVTRAAPLEMTAFLRPMGGSLSAHFHGAAFGYHPLTKGRIELEPTLTRLFETGVLRGVVHLIADERAAGGAGESEFLRGACWFAPVERIVGPEVTA